MRPAAAAALLPLLLLAAACAPRWERPGTSPAEAARAERDCGAEARALAPPRREVREVAPERFVWAPTCHDGRCWPSLQWQPAEYGLTDANAAPRAAAGARCMERRGFAAVGGGAARPTAGF